MGPTSSKPRRWEGKLSGEAAEATSAPSGGIGSSGWRRLGGDGSAGRSRSAAACQGDRRGRGSSDVLSTSGTPRRCPPPPTPRSAFPGRGRHKGLLSPSLRRRGAHKIGKRTAVEQGRRAIGGPSPPRGSPALPPSLRQHLGWGVLSRVGA